MKSIPLPIVRSKRFKAQNSGKFATWSQIRSHRPSSPLSIRLPNIFKCSSHPRPAGIPQPRSRTRPPDQRASTTLPPRPSGNRDRAPDTSLAIKPTIGPPPAGRADLIPHLIHLGRRVTHTLTVPMTTMSTMSTMSLLYGTPKATPGSTQWRSRPGEARPAHRSGRRHRA